MGDRFGRIGPLTFGIGMAVVGLLLLVVLAAWADRRATPAEVTAARVKHR